MNKGVDQNPDKADDVANIQQSENIQYLHKQLDEAARYYKSQHHKLMEALGKSEDQPPA